jgi:hypothetical protein
MITVVLVLTVLFGVSYAVYRTAKTESVGFKALVAWVVFAALDIAAVVAWAVWALVQRGTP